MLRVRDIAAAAETWLRPEQFCRQTHVRGTRNAHLADASDFAPQGWLEERHVPLPMDAEVYGDYLTVRYCEHGGYVLLEDFDSLAHVEAAILSGAGILNSFTEFMFAFISGRRRGYEVRDRAGRVWVRDGLHVRGAEVFEAASAGPAKPGVSWTDNASRE